MPATPSHCTCLIGKFEPHKLHGRKQSKHQHERLLTLLQVALAIKFQQVSQARRQATLTTMIAMDQTFDTEEMIVPAKNAERLLDFIPQQ